MLSESTTAIPFEPNLSSEFADRFDRLTDELALAQTREDQEWTIKEEIEYIESDLNERNPGKEPTKYLAALEVLLDLIEINHDIEKNSSFFVIPPNHDDIDDPKVYKQKERKVLKKERDAQFQKSTTRDFINEMETPEYHEGRAISIRSLVSDGDQLADLLRPLCKIESREARTEALDDILDPYIQVAEKGKSDLHTGRDLMDIWRYFRYTWLTPYNTVPGRNINFLIRNSALKNDPVMGIASLGSPMINLTVRDEYIGWTIEALKDRLSRKERTLEYEEQLPKERRTSHRKTRTVKRTEYLETESEYKKRRRKVCETVRPALEKAIVKAIEQIRYDDFISEYDLLSADSFIHPDDTIFEILKDIEEEARAKINDPDYDDPDPDSLESFEEQSETPLFQRKRAETLQKLLRDREYFVKHEHQSDVEFIETALENQDGRRAIKTALKESKKRRAGTCMMNIMVCGAIPPYNKILGGKLVAMALTGPEVIEIYQDKYSGQESNIASKMAGEPIKKRTELVFVDTTSLFEKGSAQYDRIRVPVPDGKIEFKELGLTKGYGSLQFGYSARKRLSAVTEFEEDRQVVRGRFGEGVAPRMRKIRRGLENLGLDGELLKHESKRIIYAADLASNARAFLRGEAEEPEYYWNFEDNEQSQIYDHWKYRWVSKRITNDGILAEIANFDPNEDFLLGPRLRQERQLSYFIQDP